MLFFRSLGKNRRSSPGFTIFELIMVIILLGILAVAAAPKLLETHGFSLEGAASMVSADLRYAQELAMSTHQEQSVSFNSGATSYTVDWRSAPVDLPSGVSISSADITFTFNPLGEPTAGGGSSVTISSGGDSRAISVEDYTGKVSVS